MISKNLIYKGLLTAFTAGLFSFLAPADAKAADVNVSVSNGVLYIESGTSFIDDYIMPASFGFVWVYTNSQGWIPTNTAAQDIHWIEVRTKDGYDVIDLRFCGWISNFIVAYGGDDDDTGYNPPGVPVVWDSVETILN